MMWPTENTNRDVSTLTMARRDGRWQAYAQNKPIEIALGLFWQEWNLSLRFFLPDTMHAYKDWIFFMNSKSIVLQSKKL